MFNSKPENWILEELSHARIGSGRHSEMKIVRMGVKRSHTSELREGHAHGLGHHHHQTTHKNLRKVTVDTGLHESPVVSLLAVKKRMNSNP